MISMKTKRAAKRHGKINKGKQRPFWGYVKEQFSLYLNSFRHLNINSSFIVLVDLLFYLLVIGLFYVFGAVLQNAAPASIQVQTMTAAQGITNDMNSFLAYIVAGTVIFIIISLLLWIVSRLIVWKLTLGKAYCADIKELGKFSLLAMMAVVASIAVLFLPINAFLNYIKQSNVWSVLLILLLPLLIALMLYLTSLSFILFIEQKEKNAWETAKKAVLLGFKRIWNFILPLLLMVVTFFIASTASRIFSLLSQTITTLLSSLMLLVFFAWARYYFADVVKVIEAEKA